jgi:hypothetical protein
MLIEHAYRYDDEDVDVQTLAKGVEKLSEMKVLHLLPFRAEITNSERRVQT